ncbi:MAG: bifunctional phosphopantothenoylcysteine decarboxylase/phosphopantothenate--cysteine ligase CoaBC [Sterolibacteriaceae bacterium]|nr:bifunctional phosphopantothenoylcysteine decarboxylase/phosphopantothenate--cysteine ligase CoaBC [Sterolibacteriaceae bacterium]MBK9085558.1 bifunctional phosphopantothenoylcysteine decarboxylase/phosphopantothenate--cysteine ligase CoaBC [Sterolibacteriaceae bacterium]
MNSSGSRRIVLGVTGGIAAYKAAELTRLLVKDGAEVHVVLTESGAHFVGAVTYQALSGNRVWTDLWDPSVANNMAHIDLTRGAQAIVIAPASADFLAKLANGLADDLLTTLCLARPRAGIDGAQADCPLLVAPAMNRQMWESPATQRNIARLIEDGVFLLGPAAGDQACGEVGYGRMLEADELFEDVISHFQPKVLAGRRVLLTAGPTFEPIDPVRGITNSSSGKMGFALARAAHEAGALVTLVSGPVSLSTPRGVARVDVQSARDMREAVMSRVQGSDVFIAVAAVADYRPAEMSQQKIKRSRELRTLNLEPNPDILAEVAALPRPPYCVGFAAESEKLEDHASAKRIAKNIPLIVGNLVQDGLGADVNRVILFDDNGSTPLAPAPKLDLARQIVAHVARRIHPHR